jgi:hypothetical protein
MLRTPQAIDEFKDYLIQSMNEDVYYQLKDWISQAADDDEDYEKVMDYFMDNLHGSLVWDEAN